MTSTYVGETPQMQRARIIERNIYAFMYTYIEKSNRSKHRKRTNVKVAKLVDDMPLYIFLQIFPTACIEPSIKFVKAGG